MLIRQLSRSILLFQSDGVGYIALFLGYEIGVNFNLEITLMRLE